MKSRINVKYDERVFKGGGVTVCEYEFEEGRTPNFEMLKSSFEWL